MQVRIIGYLLVAIAAAACGTANSTDSEGLNDDPLAERKDDAGRKCRPAAPGEHSPCGKGDHGKSDAGHGDDDDDDDDDDKEDGGKKK